MHPCPHYYGTLTIRVVVSSAERSVSRFNRDLHFSAPKKMPMSIIHLSQRKRTMFIIGEGKNPEHFRSVVLRIRPYPGRSFKR